MRLMIATGLAALALAVPALAETGPAGVEYRSAKEAAAIRAQGDIGGPAITDPEFRVLAVRRDKVGEAEVHERETDIFFVVSGRATIAVGGTLVGAHATAPGELRGSAVSGGKDYLLEPGIILTIPRGVPHWIRKTTPGFRYDVVKVPAR